MRTKTPRGLHLYFRAGEQKPPQSVRSENIAIDFKSGINQYVVGAHSIRPDGGQYVSQGEPLETLEALPAFVDNFASEENTPVKRVLKGARTITLWNLAREYVECCASEEELFAELRAQVDYDFEDAENYSDAKIKKSVNWTWKKRLQNQLYGGSKSAVKITSDEMNALIPLKNGSDAIALLWVLKHNFERMQAKPFPIAGAAMAEKEVLPGWSKNRIYRARNALVERSLISEVRSSGFDPESKSWTANLYRFGKPFAPSAQGEGF